MYPGQGDKGTAWEKSSPLPTYVKAPTCYTIKAVILRAVKLPLQLRAAAVAVVLVVGEEERPTA